MVGCILDRSRLLVLAVQYASDQTNCLTHIYHFYVQIAFGPI